MDEVLQRKWNADVCFYHESPRRLFHVRHQEESEEPRELGGAGRTQTRKLRSGVQYRGNPVQARYRSRGGGSGPQTRAENRSIFFASKFLRRRLPAILQASLA